MKKLILSFSLAILASMVLAQAKLLTVAEQSNYTKTSTHAEVMAYIAQLQKVTKLMRVETVATTHEGREIPLLVLGNPVPQNPSEVGNRPVVYIQCNIHAGEVEGKEGALMYVRDLLARKDDPTLEKLVLVVCPILNPDGNDRMGPDTRPHQNGPALVGVRHNAHMLDLNRDAMKMETREMEGVISNILDRWDPVVTMDCHTTNGSYHQEPVTFTWMMNPNGDRNLINYMRDKMMPDISATLLNKYGTLNCFYGEFVDQRDYEKGWVMYAPEPRYFSNFMGLRNRFCILNENYVYADYKSRVEGCYNLIASLVDYTISHGTEMQQLAAQADAYSRQLGTSPADSFAIKYKGVPTPEPATILTYEAEVYKDQMGRERFRKTDRKRTVSVPYIADYVATQTTPYPYAYILSINDPEVNRVLKTHGIQVEYLKDSITLEVEQFTIDSLKPIPRPVQGHYNNNVYGKYSPTKVKFEKGSIVVKPAQKFGRVAAYLLEPQSDDGFLFWNYLDKYLVPQWGWYFYPVPVYKLMQPHAQI